MDVYNVLFDGLAGWEQLAGRKGSGKGEGGEEGEEEDWEVHDYWVGGLVRLILDGEIVFEEVYEVAYCCSSRGSWALAWRASGRDRRIDGSTCLACGVADHEAECTATGTGIRP